MYQPYADQTYYSNVFKGTKIKIDDIEKYLKQASRHIDTLTFNRVVGSFDELTNFQQEIIQEVVCQQAEFEYENESILTSVLSSYSINGVSMNIGNSWNVKIIKGVAIMQDLYDLLSQTGLCCRSFSI